MTYKRNTPVVLHHGSILRHRDNGNAQVDPGQVQVHEAQKRHQHDDVPASLPEHPQRSIDSIAQFATFRSIHRRAPGSKPSERVVQALLIQRNSWAWCEYLRYQLTLDGVMITPQI